MCDPDSRSHTVPWEKLQSECQSHSQALTDRMVMQYGSHNLDCCCLATLPHCKETKKRVLTSSCPQNLFQPYELISSSRRGRLHRWMPDKSFHLFAHNHTASSGIHNSKQWALEISDFDLKPGLYPSSRAYTQSLKDTCMYVWISDRSYLPLQRNNCTNSSIWATYNIWWVHWWNVPHMMLADVAATGFPGWVDIYLS